MGPLTTILGLSAVHFFIVITSIMQPEGTAPITEFAKVFDTAGDSLAGMMGMMKYPNFVSEEWSHVLVWDLFVGRWIWLDGLKRGVFTAPAVLLTNLIGPPGLLLHALTCLASGKGLPLDISGSDDTTTAALQLEGSPRFKRADAVVKESFADLFQSADNVVKFCNLLAADVVWDDTARNEPIVGAEAVLKRLAKKQRSMRAGSRLVIDKVADGEQSTGFTWYHAADGVEGQGLRGTTFVSLNKEGKIDYVREIAEPLFKPGAAVIPLLKAVTEKATKGLPPPAPSTTFIRRDPTTASDFVNYLWNEAQGQDKGEFLRLVSDDIYYQDFNYKTPFIGKEAVAAFLDEFNFPGIKFVPEKISDGRVSCCFTWRVELAGVEQSTKGISFYTLNDQGKLCYLRDIPEPAIKPPPLRALASIVRPKLRRFNPKF